MVQHLIGVIYQPRAERIAALELVVREHRQADHTDEEEDKKKQRYLQIHRPAHNHN